MIQILSLVSCPVHSLKPDTSQTSFSPTVLYGISPGAGLLRHLAIMREHDPLVSSFTHEKARPREKEALVTLQKIASLVKPIMRARNWRVGTLAEFYPAETNLLGMCKYYHVSSHWLTKHPKASITTKAKRYVSVYVILAMQINFYR